MTQKIMIQTKDKTFFVHKKNLPMLIEFAKTFKAKLAVIEANNIEITELEDLVIKFCDQNSYTTNAKYKELEVLLPSSNKEVTKTRSQMLTDAKKIKKYIKEKFCESGIVSLKELKKQFQELNVSDSCLSNHLANVKKDLIKNNGYKFESSNKGEYKCSK